VKVNPIEPKRREKTFNLRSKENDSKEHNHIESEEELSSVLSSSGTDGDISREKNESESDSDSDKEN